MDDLFLGAKNTHYRAMVIDPPWKFSGGVKGRPQHYARMTDAEIASLPIARLAHPDGAFLFVWVTSPMAERFWHKVAPSWKSQGWRYSGRAFLWVKMNKAGGKPLFFHRDSFFTGHGFTTRKNAEDVLLFKRGRPKRLRRDVRELIIAPRREHSRKPDEMYERVEVFGAGPYIDIFGRCSRKGWDVVGNEATKFDDGGGT